jgi:acetate kinase
MIILVMNAGSSSLKFQVYDMSTQEVKAKGGVERIGMETAIIKYEKLGAGDLKYVREILDHTAAVKQMLHILLHPEHGVIKSMDEIGAVGHRIVHGGESFHSPTLITGDVKREIRSLFELAPLHNPAGYMGIKAVEANLPDVPQVAVFDTSFHQTMPPEHYMYPLPMVLYTRHKVRRYGFHGMSHNYVSEQAAKYVGKPISGLKIITCHIGNGVSVTAVEGGRSVDTSMGMTPLEGLMMGTRSGDIDPAIVTYTIAQEDLTMNEINAMLNKHSGLQGISGISGDMREITAAMSEGNKQAKLAFDMFTHRLRKYIGAYAAVLNGCDVLVFTAGIGENGYEVRDAVCQSLTYLGVEIDKEANESAVGKSEITDITAPGARVRTLVIPTNEEWMIARETYRVVQEKAKA